MHQSLIDPPVKMIRYVTDYERGSGTQGVSAVFLARSHIPLSRKSSAAGATNRPILAIPRSVNATRAKLISHTSERFSVHAP
jgi:uncharacterized protein YcnI